MSMFHNSKNKTPDPTCTQQSVHGENPKSTESVGSIQRHIQKDTEYT